MSGKKLILEGWFSIGTGHESDVDERAREKFGPGDEYPEHREECLRKGLIDKEGTVTQKGWDALNEDIAKLERNAYGWLRKVLDGARDEGHGDSGDLVGGYWFDAKDPKQVDVVLAGAERGISENDFDLDKYAWKGVSDFGIALLDISVYLNLEEEVLDKVKALEAWERTERRRGDR